MTFSSHKSGEEITDTIYVEWRCPSTCEMKSPLAFIPQVEGQRPEFIEGQLEKGVEKRAVKRASPSRRMAWMGSDHSSTKSRNWKSLTAISHQSRVLPSSSSQRLLRISPSMYTRRPLEPYWLANSAA